MEKRPFDDEVPVWRETPLDHWSTDIDPVLMAGDEWVDNENDPGTRRMAEKLGGTAMNEPFMHPMHDVTYGLDEDDFRDPIER